MKLYPIMTTGIMAFCSDIIVDPHELDTVYFMSVCGYQTTVKGIIANLLENYGISIRIEGVDYYLKRSGLGYKVLVKKLPSGLVHSILFPKIALPKNDEERQNTFFVFTDNTGKRVKIFFRHLDEKVDTPIDPSWDRWLWNLFEGQDEWLLELRTLTGNYHGYSFEFNPAELTDLISTAIKNKDPEIIACFKWKGGDQYGKSNFSERVFGSVR